MGPLLIVTFAALALYFLHVQTRRPSKFPPGPPRFPIIGSLPYLFGSGRPGGPKTFLHGILKNAKTYGNVFGFWIGKVPTVVLTDYEHIREVLKAPDSAGRPELRPLNEFRPRWQALKGTENEHSLPGVMLTSGKFWQEQRRFLLKNLRDFGFGKKDMEGIIKDSVEELIAYLRKRVGKPVPLEGTLQMSIVNALMTILVGKGMQLDDPEDRKAAELMIEVLKSTDQFAAQIATLLPHPRLLLLPGLKQWSGNAKVEFEVKQVADFLDKFVEEHIATFDPQNIRDFMDLFLAEVYKTTDVNSSFYKEKGRCFAINNLIELFGAGADTTASSLHWTFLYMLHHPHVKQKVQDEIDGVCSSSSLPSLDDRADLPYTMAVLHESLRLTCLIPMNGFHRALKEIPIGDYVIPKDATIVPSLVGVMRDPDYFNDPDAFMPERFIKPDGKFKSCERVIPFSFGKRSCLGQALAEHEYFLFFAGIMKNFDFKLSPLEDLPSYSLLDYEADQLVRSAPNFNVIFTLR